jgi:Diphthamide synthase
MSLATSENITQSWRVPWVLQCARSVPSRWKPAFSIARIDAWLSAAASATTRASPSSRSPQSAARRNALEATPRPRAAGNTETARLATSWSSSNCRLRRPRGPSSAASAMTNGAPVPLDHCSSDRLTLSCRLGGSSGASFSRRCVSGSSRLATAGRRARFPLWGRNTGSLARSFVRDGFRAVLVCVDPRVLDASFAGREYDEELLRELPPAVDPCGENGEFHTFVYAGPVFREPIRCRRGEVVERDGFVFCDLLEETV